MNKQSRAKSQRRKHNTDNPIRFFMIFGLIWMFVMLGIDGFLLHSAYRLSDARQRYVPAQGVVVESYIDSRTTSDGTSYAPFVAYSFEVGGVSHHGDRYSMFEMSTSSRGYAQDVVDRYPVGSVIEVYYDPADPSESVIDLSDRSVPYFVVLFLVPFHCVGLGLMVGGVVQIRNGIRYRHDRAVAAYIVRRSDRETVLRDAHWAGWIVFFFVTGITSFAAIFVMGFAFGFSMNRDTALWTVGVCIGAGIMVPTLMRLRSGGKAHRLLIDWHAGRFTREPDSVNIGIGSIKTVRLTTTGTNSRINDRRLYKHAISGIDDAGFEHVLLLAKGFRERGEVVRDWFAERFEAAAEDHGPPEEPGPSMPVVSEVEINRTKT